MSLENKLLEKYPMLFRNLYGDMSKTAMHWGFECGDGWYEILDKLCQCITEYALSNGLDVTAIQVKEKYGSLRFYVNGGDNTIDDFIWNAETLSAYTCEICGKSGRTRGEFWYNVRCDEHNV